MAAFGHGARSWRIRQVGGSLKLQTATRGLDDDEVRSLRFGDRG